MSRKIGVMLSYVLMIIEVLSTLLLTPYIIKSLGQAEFGVYKLVVAVNAYLVLFDLGVGNAVIRYIAKYKAIGDRKHEQQFFGVAIIFYSGVAIIAILVGIALISVFPHTFAIGLSDEEIVLGQRLLRVAVINSAFSLWTTAFNNVLIAYERFAVSKSASILQLVARILLTYYALQKGMGSIGIMRINLLLTVVCRTLFALYVFFVIKLLPKFRRIEEEYLKEIVAYSSLILLQMLATLMNSTVDQVLIGSVVSSSATILAVYGVGAQIVQYYQSIGTAYTGVLMPGVVRMVERRASPKELTGEMIRIGRLVLMTLSLILSGFSICGKQFIRLWAGEQNERAYIVALLLMIAHLFILTESIGSQILWAKNCHKEQSILKMIIVIVNIFLTLMLIKWNPLIGAATGTFFSLVVGDIGVMNYIFVKKIGINLRYYYKEITSGIIPCAILSAIVGYLFKPIFAETWIGLFGNIAVICVFYGASMFLFGMNKYEKQLCFSLFNGVIKKLGGR